MFTILYRAQDCAIFKYEQVRPIDYGNSLKKIVSRYHGHEIYCNLSNFCDFF